MYRGSLGDILAIRAQAVSFFRFFLLPFSFFVETIGLMLIGMGLYRLNWWQGGFAMAHYRKVAFTLIPLGWALGDRVAFDIAGRGQARPDSLIAAIRMADQIATRREA